MIIREVIYQPLTIKCNKCGNKTVIDVPYRYVSSDKNEDLYVKDRLDKVEDLCNCDGIYSQIEDEYTKIDLNYTIKH